MGQNNLKNVQFVAKLSLNSTQLNFNLNWGWDSLIFIKSIIYVAAAHRYVAAALRYVAAAHRYVAAAPSRKSTKLDDFEVVQ